METIESMDLRIPTPTTMIISGGTGCGKSTLTKELLKNMHTVFYPVPEKIYWAYSIYQPGYIELEKIPNLELIQGVPNFEELSKQKSLPKLLVLDDLVTELQKSQELINLFTKGSHHFNCSIIYITQNPFLGNRSCRINSKIMILFKNPADKLAPLSIGRQLFPKQNKFFSLAFDDATKAPHTYLVLDLNQSTSDKYRVRNFILPQSCMFCYIPE